MERNEARGTPGMNEKTKRRRKNNRHHREGSKNYISTDDRDRDFAEEKKGKKFHRKRRRNELQESEMGPIKGQDDATKGEQSPPKTNAPEEWPLNHRREMFRKEILLLKKEVVDFKHMCKKQIDRLRLDVMAEQEMAVNVTPLTNKEEQEMVVNVTPLTNKEEQEMAVNVTPLTNKEEQEMAVNVTPLTNKEHSLQDDHRSRNLADKITLLESTVQKYRTELASTTTSVTAMNIDIANLQEKIAELNALLDTKDKKISQLETQLSITFEDKEKTEKQFDTLLDELQNLDLSGYFNYSDQSSGDVLDKKQSLKKQHSRFSVFFDSVKNDKLPALKRRLSTDTMFARFKSEHSHHKPVTHNGTVKPSELKTNIIEEEIPKNIPQEEDLSDNSYKDGKESKRDPLVKSKLCIIM